MIIDIYGDTAETVNTDILNEEAERALYMSVMHQTTEVEPLFADAKYTDALLSLAALRADVDHFFDSVMVMADDDALKNNRLALLNKMRDLFLHVADLSRLQ